MSASYPDHPQEDPASAAQVRDLSAQIQAIQAQLAAQQARRRIRRRSRVRLLYTGALAALLAVLVASLIHPLRQDTQIRVVHDVRLVPVVRVVHDVRVIIATPTRPQGAGVAVCTDRGFAPAGALCLQPATTLMPADLAGAWLSYTGKDGGLFGATQVTVALGQLNGAGSVTPSGRIAVNVLLTSTSQASRLQGVFDALGVPARPGSTYLIEVDQGDTNLGAARFTIAGFQG